MKSLLLSFLICVSSITFWAINSIYDSIVSPLRDAPSYQAPIINQSGGFNSTNKQIHFTPAKSKPQPLKRGNTLNRKLHVV